MKICIIDFETTSLDIKTATPLEFAALIVNEAWKREEMIHGYFKYYQPIEIPEYITKINGITEAILFAKGEYPLVHYKKLLEATKDCQYFLAHNMRYDAGILATALQDLPVKKDFPQHPIYETENWLCSIRDVPYDKRFKCKTLTHLAIDHGIWPAPGEKPHSAATDVCLIQRLMVAGGYTIERMLSYRKEPFVYLAALIPPPWEDAGVGKKAAQEEGFKWEQWPGDTLHFPKQWIKRIREGELEEEKSKTLSFKRQILKTEAKPVESMMSYY